MVELAQVQHQITARAAVAAQVQRELTQLQQVEVMAAMELRQRFLAAA